MKTILDEESEAYREKTEEEEKKRMDEEKLDKFRKDQNKDLNYDFDSEFKQMINVSFCLKFYNLKFNRKALMSRKKASQTQ